MIRRLDLADATVAESLVELQRAAYAVEASLLGVASLPPQHERAADIQRSGETFLGVVEDGRLVGAVSYRRDGGTVDIHRLVVHPDAFRQGHATRLLEALDEAESDATRTIVATGAANVPARRLYEQRGFTPVRERPVGDGLVIIELERCR